ncbi:G1 family endopeptidase [Streptomyces sp. LP11]|uniref:G1 family endopeptidase n=1 Tax=Streptomyces pyxinicus TaxID=2970331 RepID=A0ABT2B7D0_9ACTN|nr:G1 family glutamic endopeptidase [Streptomyces sp. LP11]MCS0604424.1 G1 family endopeptidase [Streptomyces sp. LP11]
MALSAVPSRSRTLTAAAACALALVAAGQVPQAQASSSGPASAQVTEKSYNWGGYILRQAGLTKITAHFIVPTADCSAQGDGNYTNAAFWIGLDGGLPTGQNTTIEQAGVDVNCLEELPQYHAWWEVEGPSENAGSHQITETVRPGDFIKIAVEHETGAQFRFNVVDYGQVNSTDGPPLWSDETTASVPGGVTPQLNSAEAVAERPVDGRWLYPLTRFGDFDFLRVKVNGAALRTYPEANLVKKQLVQNTGLDPSGANLLADTGPLAEGAGDAFHIIWRHYGTTRTP